jgi:hypothetical protein
VGFALMGCGLDLDLDLGGVESSSSSAESESDNRAPVDLRFVPRWESMGGGDQRSYTLKKRGAGYLFAVLT